MPIKMVASRRHYLKAEEREVDTGQTFNAIDDREADRLEKMRRARRVSVTPAPVAKELKAEEKQPESRRYRRSDMRAEE